MLVLQMIGDEGAATLPPVHEPFVLEKLDGLPHGDPRDLEFPFKLFEGRDFLSRQPLAGFDSPPQCRRDLNVEGNGAAGVSDLEFRHPGNPILRGKLQSKALVTPLMRFSV